jgi:hypothetical protein
VGDDHGDVGAQDLYTIAPLPQDRAFHNRLKQWVKPWRSLRKH